MGGLRRTMVLAAALLLAASGCDDDAANGGNDAGHGHDDGHEHDHDPPPDVVDSGTTPPDGSVAEGFEWDIPAGFPRPIVPEDNPMSAAKVELGRHIFYDKRLSGNGTQACASCHLQANAFADNRGRGLGSTGEVHPRGSMSLANVAYSPTLTWANPLMTELERQAQLPIFGDDPIELGMTSIEEVEKRFREEPRYPQLFAEAFPGDGEPITMENSLKAIAAFERTLLSGNSPYDKFIDGRDPNALSESAQRGMVFVTTNEDHRFECNHCHGGFAFTDHVVWEGLAATGEDPPFHQTGLYDTDGKGSYPEPNTGVHNTSLKPEDMGKFKAPTLRNIALTAPYMHDGSIETLQEVLDHYAKGGRMRSRSQTDSLLQPFEITEQEKADIIAFLESLTDEEFITNPKFGDPWAQ